MKLLKMLSFGLTGLLILFMIAATLLEKQYGTDFATRHLYASPCFVAGWGALAFFSLAYLFWRKVQKQPATLLLHLSLVVILAGALITHIWGIQGSVHLRQNAETPVNTFIGEDGKREQFPFTLSLRDFRLEYYPGTLAPMDFVSSLLIKDEGTTEEGEVSMNHIYSYRHYRFYQSRYDSDGKGTTLAVSYDPWGIATTYTGYGLLLLSMILFVFGKQSRFRQLQRNLLQKSVAVCLLLLATSAQAKNEPRTLPCETAAKFGDLYIYYNDRVCPLQTLARDFTVKLYGKPSYRGLTAEQVLVGWFFYYDTWKEEPCIRIKSKEIARLLGINGKYAALKDFADTGGYKLDKSMQEHAEVKDKRGWEEANEKFSLISMIATGSIWKIYPFATTTDPTGVKRLHWYSLADRLPPDMPAEIGSFVRGSMNYVGEQVARGNFEQVNHLLDKIRKYQRNEGGKVLPSDFRFQAEKCYNSLNNSFPLAIICIVLGMLAFVFYCRIMATRQSPPLGITRGFSILLAVLFLYLCFTITLRGIAGGHIPMSNGHETMQLMAACTALFSLLLHRKMPIVLGFGFLICGLALIVSMLGERNPQVTQLMPVLQSPLLSFHVMVIMMSYSLLAFIMFNGLTALILHGSRQDHSKEIEQLQLISNTLLYPAVFLLAAGIFIGAVWANVSWGRYWGWDPKEVWALITMLVYTFALHSSSLPRFRHPLFFHIFSVVAFFCVLITYFGVNFLLGGMHSYA